MTIHIWMHWFWITVLICKGFLLSLTRHVQCSSIVAEAGLPDASFILKSEDYVLLKDKLFKFASQGDLNLRTRRAVEDEDVGDEATTVPVAERNETVSNEATSGEAYQSQSDVGDTYGGGTGDGFQYPLKKYTKLTKYGKSKLKPKTTEETVADYNDELTRSNSTSETFHVNDTIENSTLSLDGDNQTSTSTTTTTTTSEENNSTVSVYNVTEKVEATSEAAVVNVTEEHSEVLETEANLTVENKLDESVVQTTVEPFIFNNRVAAATSSEIRERLNQPLDAGSITGITLGIVVISGFIGAISFVLYRRKYLNKPQALNDKSSNLDSSGYIDETSLRENSEEMYSLDNDSFLNSLEAMTIQNYWTENVKHTKL